MYSNSSSVDHVFESMEFKRVRIMNRKKGQLVGEEDEVRNE